MSIAPQVPVWISGPQYIEITRNYIDQIRIQFNTQEAAKEFFENTPTPYGTIAELTQPGNTVHFTVYSIDTERENYRELFDTVMKVPNALLVQSQFPT